MKDKIMYETNNQTRREFLKLGAVTLAGGAIATRLGIFDFLKPEAVAEITEGTGRRWGFVVDTTKCVGCGMCVQACKLENGVPFDSDVSRTWVERYIQKTDGEVIIDSPNLARDGFITNNPLGEQVPEEDIAKAFFVPKLCNHCDHPSCVKVCPVGATYKTTDGVVLVDREWCIGCGYCITNCPYGARFFHPTLNVVDKCTFCYHRITKGMNSACVEACTFGARKIGDLNDPGSEVHKIVNTERVAVLRPHTHNEPQVFYIGLDHIVV
jgi:Fe-S-cluster-containing dehydrogenase component